MGAAAGPVARQVKLRGAYGAAPNGTPALACRTPPDAASHARCGSFHSEPGVRGSALSQSRAVLIACRILGR